MRTFATSCRDDFGPHADFSPLLNRFIGRQADLSALAGHVDAGVRLVSLVGPAGVGKTRLAMELVAQRRLAGQRVTFCNVSRIREAEELPAAVAWLLDTPVLSAGSTRENVEMLGRALASRGPLLLVLDNVEPIIEAAAWCIRLWLQLASNLTILVTSRETLRVPGEVVHDLQPLPEAVELFLKRARSLKPHYAWTPEDIAAVRAVVARLDHLPLAIELAASRARLLEPKEMLARLEKPFELLAGRQRGVSERQTSLRNALVWSWDLLDEHERRALLVTSVFRGGFSLPAAEYVLNALRDPAGPTSLELMQSLVDKSLLRREHLTTRFVAYEMITEFAAERLSAQGDEAAALVLHAEHYLHVFESLRIGQNSGDEMRPRLEMEQANYRAILQRFASHAERSALALSAAVALASLERDRSLSPLDARLLDEAMDHAPATISPALLAEASLIRAACRQHRGDAEQAVMAARTALAAAEHAQNPGLLMRAHLALARALHRCARVEQAFDEFQLARHRAQREHEANLEIEGLLGEGACLLALGQAQDALQRFRQALSLAQSFAYRAEELQAEAMIAFHELTLGHFEAAQPQYQRVIELAQARGSTRHLAQAKMYLAWLHFEQERLAEARTYLDAAALEARALADELLNGWCACLDGLLCAAQDDVDEAARRMDRAVALLRPHPLMLEVVRIHEGQVHWAKGRAALALGDLSNWARCRRAAENILEKTIAGDLLPRSADARMAVRMLKRRWQCFPEPGKKLGQPGTEELRVAADASWFELGTGPRVLLQGRTKLQLILSYLVDLAVRTPGAACTGRELIRLAWHGEKLTPGEARNRLHVALNALRKLGLRDVLQRVTDGYRLEGKVQLLRA